jgi:hypothetical protein
MRTRCARREDLLRLQRERAKGDLGPSLHTFFRDIDYLKLCVDCVKRLISIPHGVENTVSSSLRLKLRHVPAKDCRIVVQVAEDRFITVGVGTWSVR